MLRPMQWRPACLATVLVLGLVWVGCDDKVIELAHAPGETATTGDATSASNSQAQNVTASASLTSGGFSTSPDTSTGGGPGMGTSEGAGFGPNPSVGGGVSRNSGPTTSVGGADANMSTDGSAGSGPGFDGCAAGDLHCQECALARSCTVPTPDCTDDEHWRMYWSDHCSECVPEADVCIQSQRRCFAESSQCHAVCLSDLDCPGQPNAVCHTFAGVCVECFNDLECKGKNNVCFAGKCVACRTHSDCGPGAHCTAGLCRECVSDLECMTGSTCDGYRCVECETNEDCLDSQHCNEAGECEF